MKTTRKSVTEMNLATVCALAINPGAHAELSSRLIAVLTSRGSRVANLRGVIRNAKGFGWTRDAVVLAIDCASAEGRISIRAGQMTVRF